MKALNGLLVLVLGVCGVINTELTDAVEKAVIVKRKLKKPVTNTDTAYKKTLDLSLPSATVNGLSLSSRRKELESIAPNSSPVFPVLLKADASEPKDFELGARLITRDWKEVNEEEKDWRTRVEGAAVELKFRN